MGFITAPPPSAASFEAALRFIFDAWAALPAPGDSPPAEADVELHRAFLKWCEAKSVPHG